MNKHKMSKKLLATIMTFAMLITMFPSGVFAQDSGNDYQNGQVVSGTDDQKISAENNGVTVNKYVTKDGDKYNLTLEGYASNQLTTTSTSTPLDIVLVLDVSGSMDENIIDASDTWKEVYSDELDTSKTYYIEGKRNHIPVRYHEGNRYFEGGWYPDYEWEPIEPKTSESDNDRNHVQFYTHVTTEPVTKLEALKTAVNNFTTEVNKKNQEITNESNKHRIALIKFSGDIANSIGNDTYENRGYEYNNTQVMNDFTSDKSVLDTNVNSIEVAGSTAADYGLELANDVIDGQQWGPSLKGSRDNAKKVVIFFTDGEPNHGTVQAGQEFESNIANSAIEKAHDLKENNVTIYSVGVFENESYEINRYMNGISSNYPDATGYYGNNLGTQKDDKYYFTADDPEGLTNVFEGIAEDVTTGDLEVNPDKDATLEDTLSQYFDLPAGITKDQVKVKYVEATGYDPEKGFTFANEASEMPEGTDIHVDIDEENENIKVSGFDYKANAASYEKQDDGTYKVSGGKLVVTFKIEVDENACLLDPVENGQYPTNDTKDSKAKLAYKANDQAEDNNAVTALNESPKVYFDNTKFDANGTDVTIQVYLDGNKVDPDQYVTLTRKTGTNDNWTYFNRVDKSDNVLTYDFNYNPDPESGFNCVDINVALNKDDVVLQGVHSYQSHGKGGTNNVSPESNGTYTVDNIASDEKADTVDCTIYLRTKYSAEYYLDGDKQTDSLTDNTVYLAGEDVDGTTPEGEKPGDGQSKWMDWKNDGYATSITVKPLPQGNVSGWTLDGEQVSAGATVNVGENVDKADNHVFKFYATTVQQYKITINYEDQDGKVLQPKHTETQDKNYEYNFTVGSEVLPKTITTDDGTHYAFNRIKEGSLSGTLTGNVNITAEYLLDENENGMPDEYEVTVTYKVVNGTWSDGKTEEITKDFVIAEFDGSKWTAKDVTLGTTIPQGMKANVGYDQNSGKWNADIKADTKVTEDVTYTYTFDAQMYAVTIEYQNEEGKELKANFTDEAQKSGSDYSYAVSDDESGDIPFIIKDGDTQYVYDRLAKDSAALSGKLDGNKTITAIYAIDENGNNIPDKYEVTVTYKVENGTWSDGGSDPIKENFVIKEFKDGQWIDKAQALGDTIPQGMKANTGYDPESGKWDADIDTDTAVTKDATYTYKFTEQKYTLTYNATSGHFGEVEADTAVASDLAADTYILWTENGAGQKPDGDVTFPTHDPEGTGEDAVNIYFAYWTTEEPAEGADYVFDKGDKGIPAKADSVTIENGNVEVFAVWGYDRNGNEKPDITEETYNLIYDVNGGYFTTGNGEEADKVQTQSVTDLLADDYPIWHKNELGKEDGTIPSGVAWPYHDDKDGVPVALIGWSSEKLDTIYDDGDELPDSIIEDNVTIVDQDVTVYAVWGYDRNGNGTPDVNEDQYTLTYHSTSGYFGDAENKDAVVSGLLAKDYDLWTKTGEDTYTGTIPENVAWPTHDQAAAPVGSVIADEGTNVNVAFIGWSTEDPGDKIYAAGEAYPATTDKVTIPPTDTGAANEDVYAVWGYDENGDGIADAQQIVIVPADITIYQGGEGYEGVVEGENGTNIGENHEGLPEPGYYLILPYQLDEELEGADNTIDLTGKLHLHYTNAAGQDARDWDLALYNETAGKDGNKVAADRDHDGIVEDGEFYYVYQLKQSEGNNYPVRLEIKDGDTFKTTDDFDFAIDSLYETYPMRLYNTPDLDRELVTAQIKVNGNWTDVNSEDVFGEGTVRGIARGFGTLTIRGTVDEEPVSTIGTEAPADDVTQITAVESGTEKNVYNVNSSDIPVINQDAVQFLADTIVDPEGTSTAQLKDAAQAENSAIGDDYTFDFSYLDLVDTSNGNAYVTLADEENMSVDLYWPYPEDMDKSEPVYIVHYDGLDRDFNGANLADELNKGDVSVNVYSVDSDEFTLTDTGNGYKITTSTFSPFAIVYKQEQSVTPDPGPGGGGDPDRPGLNLEDHYSYIVGYPEDYRTGEATDDESLWPVKPQGKITRAEVATIFYRLLNNETRTENWTTSNDFTDVDAGDWYNTPISTLSSMGIIVGYNDGSFQPNAPITRAEFAAIAVRFYQNNDVNYEEGLFTDIDGSEWFADAIAAAYEHGIIGGYVDGSFQPNNQITRAEAAAIVNRTTDRFPDKDHLLDAAEMRTWPDNADPDAWYYADIQEATNSHEYYKMDDPDGEEGDQIEQWTERGEDVDWDAVEAYQESVH